MNNLHPAIAASLANWMPKHALAHVECAQAAIETIVPTMAEQLREEYASGLDAPDSREVEH